MNYHNTGKLLIGAQDDENRVKYGDGLIKEYSERFTKELGNIYSVTTLKIYENVLPINRKRSTTGWPINLVLLLWIIVY